MRRACRRGGCRLGFGIRRGRRVLRACWARPRRPCHDECPRGLHRARAMLLRGARQLGRAIQGRAGQCRGQAGRVRQGAGQAVVRAGRRATVAAGNAHGNRLRRCRQGLFVDVVVGTWRRAGTKHAKQGCKRQVQTGQKQADEHTFFMCGAGGAGGHALVAACFAVRA